MEIPKKAAVQERRNLYYIYLFCVEEGWWSFGYSAYYLSLMYPELKPIVERTSPERGGDGEMPRVQVPDSYLLTVSAFHDILVSDAHIQISAPPTAYCYRYAYDEWHRKLIADCTNPLI